MSNKKSYECSTGPRSSFESMCSSLSLTRWLRQSYRKREKRSHFRLLRSCILVWVFGTGRVLACWFRSIGSFDRSGHTSHCNLRVHCFGFSGLVACSLAGFARTGPSLKNNGSITKRFIQVLRNPLIFRSQYGYLLEHQSHSETSKMGFT